jgi:ABC-2 type transport system ATP-binding protein
MCPVAGRGEVYILPDPVTTGAVQREFPTAKKKAIEPRHTKMKIRVMNNHMTTDLIESVETEKRPIKAGADYEEPAQVMVRNLTKRYGDLTALAGVSFDVSRGEVFGLLGPNGAGKTTTVAVNATAAR